MWHCLPTVDYRTSSTETGTGRGIRLLKDFRSDERSAHSADQLAVLLLTLLISRDRSDGSAGPRRLHECRW